MKNYLGELSSKVTRQNGERSKILVSNPGSLQLDGTIGTVNSLCVKI